MMFNELVFKFLDEFFLNEASGTEFSASTDCQKERWSICESCEHYDEPEEGCKYCGCYLPHKIKDPWGDCPLDKWISNDQEWKSIHYEQLKKIIIDKYPAYKDIIERHEGIN
jgi:hypothetical protein